jgi:hypothetical protein
VDDAAGRSSGVPTRSAIGAPVQLLMLAAAPTKVQSDGTRSKCRHLSWMNQVEMNCDKQEMVLNPKERKSGG